MKTYINGFLLLLLLSACNVSKNIETPKPALPDTFRNAAVTSDTSSIADIQWKTFLYRPYTANADRQRHRKKLRYADSREKHPGFATAV